MLGMVAALEKASCWLRHGLEKACFDSAALEKATERDSERIFVKKGCFGACVFN